MRIDKGEMRRVMAAYPDLSDFGFGVFLPHRYTPAERAAKLAAEREALLEDRSLAQFTRARSWLAALPRTVRPNPDAGSSYGLKHIAAHEIGYVTNGVFIAAAIAEGIGMARIPDSPNAYFSLAKRGISEARKRIIRRNEHRPVLFTA